MKRRAALAVALTLTTIAGFLIVTYSVQIGFFGSSGDSEVVASDLMTEAAEATSVPALTPTQASSLQVIDEYIYQDVFIPVQGGQDVGGTQQDTPAERAEAPPDPTPRAADGNSDLPDPAGDQDCDDDCDDDGDDDDDEVHHEGDDDGDDDDDDDHHDDDDEEDDD